MASSASRHGAASANERKQERERPDSAGLAATFCSTSHPILGVAEQEAPHALHHRDAGILFRAEAHQPSAASNPPRLKKTDVMRRTSFDNMTKRLKVLGRAQRPGSRRVPRLRTGSIACAIKLEIPMNAASSRRAQKATARPMGPALLTETHPLRKSNAHATLCWRMQFKKEKPA